MGIFSKKEYDVIELPYYIDFNGDSNYLEQMKEALFIDLSFIGMYKEKELKFSVSLWYDNVEEYEKMLQFLSQYEKTTKIAIQINKENINDYKIDICDMANKLQNDEIKKLVIMGYGIPFEVNKNMTEKEFLYKVKQEAVKRRVKMLMPIMYVLVGILALLCIMMFASKEYVAGFTLFVLTFLVIWECIFMKNKANNLGNYAKHVLVYGKELEKIANDVKKQEEIKDKNNLER